MTAIDGHVELRALVVSADGCETDLVAIESALDHFGVPYDTIIATKIRLTEYPLCDSAGGRYQAIFLTTGDLTYFDDQVQGWVSALDDDDRATLADYQRRFGARLVLLYTTPSPVWTEHGLVGRGVRDTGAEPWEGRLTSHGQDVFWYLDPDASVPFGGAYLYLAEVTSPSTVPLLVTPDGHAVVSIRTAADGREQLATTVANAPQLVHSLLLAHGIINWAMRGVWVGTGEPNLSVQVDDVLITNAVWDGAAASDTTGRIYRATATDIQALVVWQTQRRQGGGVTDQFRIELGFVGFGAEVAGAGDGLMAALVRHQAEFQWFNHTWDHLSLDNMGYEDAVGEIQRNDIFAQDLGLTHYAPEALVQGDVSGLDNLEFLRAAEACGIRVLVADTSRPGWSAVPPNHAVAVPGQPGLMIVPRHPTNLFCNVTTPDEWVTEYNYYYGVGGRWADTGYDSSYSDLIERESEVLLRYLLRADNAPLMFHQANLRAYDGVHSLLSDLLDATLDKYSALIRLPVATRPLHLTGRRMGERAAATGAEVVAALSADGRVMLRATADAVVDVTGVDTGDDVDWYGAQPVSHVQLKAGLTRWLTPARRPPLG